MHIMESNTVNSIKPMSGFNNLTRMEELSLGIDYGDATKNSTTPVVTNRVATMTRGPPAPKIDSLVYGRGEQRTATSDSSRTQQLHAKTFSLAKRLPGVLARPAC